MIGPVALLFSETADFLEAAVRAYVPLAKPEEPKAPKKSPLASQWTLIFDTETTTDPRSGFGSARSNGGPTANLCGAEFFTTPRRCRREQRMLVSFTRQHGLELMTAEQFIETVFFKLAYELRATIVGFNLLFGISRLAFRHGSARRRPMRGFSFQLSTKPWWPPIQVKHLDRKASMIRSRRHQSSARRVACANTLACRSAAVSSSM